MTRVTKGMSIEFVGLNGEVYSGRVTQIDLNADNVYLDVGKTKPLILSKLWLENDAKIISTRPAPAYKRPSDWWKKIPTFGWLLYIIGLLFIAFGVESFWDELSRDNRGFFWFGFLFLAVGFFVHWRSHSHVE